MSRKKTQKQSSGVIHGTSSSLSPGNSIAKILESPGGLVLVRAGAGTGKTRLLIEYYLAVLDKLLRERFNIKDALQSVLAVTFTNRAADEMLERVTKTLQQRGVSDAEHVASFAEVSTIDAFCAKCLRKYAPFIGLNPDFQIIDGIGARLLFDSVFERLCKENSLPRIDSTYALSTFRNSSWNTICALKSRLILAKDVANLLGNTTHAGFLGTVYAEYDRELLARGQLDFGGLLVMLHKLIAGFPDAIVELKRKYRYVLVDEYQDTTEAQDRCLRQIAGDNYFVVGDFNQSIYAFRGAQPDSIRRMENNSSTRTISLVRNFRSDTKILKLVNRAFRDKLWKYDTLIARDGAEEGECGIILAPDSQEEARLVACKIRELIDSRGIPAEEIAILLREVKNEARRYEDALREQGIEFISAGASGFFDRPEIKDIVAILGMLDNPFREDYLVHAALSPAFGLADDTVAALSNMMSDPELNEEQTRRRHITHYDALGRMKELSNLSAEQNRLADRFRSFIAKFLLKKRSMRLTTLIREVLVESGYELAVCRYPAGERRRRLANIEKFLEIARSFQQESGSPDLKNFMKYIDAIINNPSLAEGEADIGGASGAVRIMSIHQAKGLEFSIVFVGELRPRKFPDTRIRGTPFLVTDGGLVVETDENKKEITENEKKKRLEEEWRLFYVASTRAKHKLYLCGAPDRDSRGKEKLSDFMAVFLEPNVDENGWQVKRDFHDLLSMEAGNIEIHLHNSRKEPSSVEVKTLKRKVKELLQEEQIVASEIMPSDTMDFTVTGLSVYAQCPLKYQYRYILGMPPNPGLKPRETPEDGLEPGLFGTLVHRLLEEYFREKKFGTVWTRKRIKEKFASLAVSSGVSQEKLKSVFLPEIEQITEWFIGSEFDIPADAVMYLEQPFAIRVDGYPVKGTIDRVDRIGGHIQVVDYKTSRLGPLSLRGTPEGCDEAIPYHGSARLGSEFDFQMNVYRYAVESVFGVKVSGQLLLFLRDKKGVSVKIDPHIYEQIQGIIRRIGNSEFKATPGPHCWQCDFRLFCPHVKKQARSSR